MKPSTLKRRAKLQAKPDCFTDEQWATWSQAADAAHPHLHDWACTDCTVEFKAEMELQDRCAWPCVQFFRLPDGSLEGRRMSVKRRTITLKQEN
jgi:hypothetical protein